ncbi:hypothetical protein Scep_029487 [Stephania cephalantha]|uniref:Uncharacterized protein n=1 Tax=Stephania cephalantha TaxID=152367 RepID=A0AAP0DXY3_9MAGN
MKMGWDLGTGLNRKLTSWKSLSDPSIGDFVYELDRRGLLIWFFETDRRSLFRQAVEWISVQWDSGGEEQLHF